MTAQKEPIKQGRFPLRRQRIDLFPKRHCLSHQKQQYKLENLPAQ
jgi:hypothetical protein